MESVRPATPADLSRCADLLTGARQEVGHRRGGEVLLATGADATQPRPTLEDPARSLARWLDDDDAVVLVGLFEQVVVGVAAGTSRSATGLIECCYVEPGARRVGVGSALVTELADWFARRGCTGVDALALPGDRETKQLLEAAGFSARLLVLHRPMP